jgi:hypothetical protein
MVTCTKQNDAILVDVQIKRNSKWQQDFLLTSDVHIDNAKCKREMLKRHFSEMVDRNAYWMDNGDFFDAMGGKYDKRSNKQDILPELQTSNYFDTLVEFGGKFITPEIASRTILLADGNHELSITSHHEINLLDRLQKQYAPNAIRGEYDGFIRFSFKDNGVTYGSLTMFRTHGTGGNAPVTRGAIQTNRRQDMYLADVFVSGHIHTAYSMPRPRLFLNKNNKVEIQEVEHIQLGTYKDSTKGTWERMKGFSPPMLGGCWLSFRWMESKLDDGQRIGRVVPFFERAR